MPTWFSPSSARSIAITAEPPPNWSPPLVQPDPPINTLAVASLVVIFVFWPAGLVCGMVARKQIRERDERGAGLALAGMIVNAVLTVFAVLVFALLILFFGPGILTARATH